VSSYWRRGESIAIRFTPDAPRGWLVAAKQGRPRLTLRKLLGETLPDRLAATLCDQLRLDGELGAVTDKALTTAEARLADWRFTPTGSEGFAKAEVTAGGISTAELSLKTMAARRMAGLYAIGEAVDVTGWLGGYNFQWAWASGWAAGQAVGA
jgi:predicted flavoprotein YhiN